MLDWLSASEEEERRELAACGVVLSPEGVAVDPEAAQRDAVVSQLQRRMIALEADRKRYYEACQRECEMIQARYHDLVASAESQYLRTEQIVLEIAERSGFEKAKAKSRKTPWGAYGVRRQAAKVEILDPAALLAWARAEAAWLVEEPPPKPVPARVPHAALCEYVFGEADATPVIPPGVVLFPERDAPFVKLADVPSEKFAVVPVEVE